MNFKCTVRRLQKEDFDQPCSELAVFLLGKVFVKRLENGFILKGKIVETECYLGGEDKASHSYRGKRTTRNEPMYMTPGTAYVYKIYYSYHCFNISSKESGAVVLIRALEPLVGEEVMYKYRVNKSKSENRIIKPTKLCDGPSKLCIAFNLTKENTNKLDLGDINNNRVWIEDYYSTGKNIVIHCPRIGIGPSAEEWVSRPLRYYIFNNKSVSKRDKEVENKSAIVS